MKTLSLEEDFAKEFEKNKDKLDELKQKAMVAKQALQNESEKTGIPVSLEGEIYLPKSYFAKYTKDFLREAQEIASFQIWRYEHSEYYAGVWQTSAGTC